MRRFYVVGFAPENRVGKAVDLESHEIPGCTPEAIRKAGLSGKPFLGFSTLTLLGGKRLGSLPPGVKLTVRRRAKDNLDFDVVVNGIGWKVFSNRLAETLQDVAPNDVELLPVQISGLDGQTLREDFCVVNILQMLDAMSDTKTVRSPIKIGTRNPVIKLVLAAAKVPIDIHVFRVTGCESDFLVDDVAKNALTRQPHDGLAFTPVEEE